MNKLDKHKCASCLTVIRSPGICRYCRRVFDKEKTLLLLARAEFFKQTEYMYKGETLSLTNWAKRLGVSLATLSSRLNHRNSIEEAFEKPVRKLRKYEKQNRVS